jgi:histidyl-tRNA synthetase
MFPEESERYTFMEAQARRIFGVCGFREWRTPLLELTELFRRTIGDETDVVQKEMYTFVDAKGRSLSLRPEATAGIVRAYVQESCYERERVSRVFTCGPMFRHERPQKGRMRQFHQINCECLGDPSPMADAEMILMLLEFLKAIGIGKTVLKLNSLGCVACRPAYVERLGEFLAKVSGDLCPDCKRRAAANTMRVLDCKRPECRAVLERGPKMSDFQCADCRDHFGRVTRLLDAGGAAYETDPCLVRGLDYYCRTAFEVLSADIGAQSAVAGGGRYDGLVWSLNGPDIPGVGFACGLERLAMLMPPTASAVPDFHLLVLDEGLLEDGFALMQDLRGRGLSGVMNHEVSGFKGLMRQADRSGAWFCLLLGPDEAAAGAVTVKDMREGGQRTVPRENVYDILAGDKS